ncbi:MAG: thiolase family protein [Actinobacteria bacterium]|nr:thiolase family protein [Actinomycetota bacterium]MBU1943003.1 thiolase family protein [Actinomycetota bacterium]MBU2687757.1 thiolase family protein [Actinomycetota bacterium]
MGDDVYIVGAGMTRFGKYPDKGIKQLTAEAMEALAEDLTFDKKDIQAAWFSNTGWGIYQGQHGIRGEVALAPVGIQGIAITNVENACAGGSTALREAWMGIKAGLYDVVLAVGAEKVWFPEDKKKMFEGFMSGADVEFIRTIIEQFQADAKKKASESKSTGKEKQGGHSAFMDIYAMGARVHMQQYGTTQRQLACIAAKNHHHGSMNPLAQYQMDMSVDEVLDDVMVAYPLTRSMCAPVGDGGAAAILCSERALSRFPDARPVRIRACTQGSGSLPDSGLESIGPRVARETYEAAGLGPEDIDLAEVHDATSFGELAQYEELGLCPVGEGGPFAESGATALGGKIPVNTSGGLECRGHPIGASGIAMAYDLCKQLRGECGPRQVEGARIALQENGGGFIGLSAAALCMFVFESMNGTR